MRTLRQLRRAPARGARALAQGVRISELPLSNVVNDNDQFELNQGGMSRSATLLQMVGARVAPITVYVSTTGSSANDGLSAGSPVATGQQALDLCAMMAARRPGPFIIQFAPGTYTVLAELTYSPWLFIGSPVWFRGAVDGAGVPTVIIRGSTDGSRTHDFLSATDAVKFTASSVMMRNFLMPFSSAHAAQVALSGVWTKNCQQPISVGNAGWGSAGGGVWDGFDDDGHLIDSSVGFGNVIGSFYNLRQANNVTGLVISNFYRSVIVDECSSGHMDHLRIEGSDAGSQAIIGVEFTRGAGMSNMSGTGYIHKCGIGILARNAANVLVANGFDFGQGTPDACGTNIVSTAGPTDQQINDTNFDSRVVYKRAVLVQPARRNSTVEFTAWKPFALVRGRMRERDLVAQFMVNGICPDAPLIASTTLRLKLGAKLLATWSLPIGAAYFMLQGTLTAVDATGVIGNLMMAWGSNTLPPAWVATTINTTADAVSLTAETDLLLTAQMGNLADSFQLRPSHVFTSLAGIAG